MPDERQGSSDEQVAEKGFEELLDELARVVERLEKGNLPLQESIALYTRGVGLLQAARKTLQEAQAKLEVLIASGPDGPEVSPLDPEAFLRERG